MSAAGVAARARERHARMHEGFWDRVDMSGGPDACWPWTGQRNIKTGYGYFTVWGKIYLAHRRALELSLGRDIAPGLEAAHRCDNPPCCNPAHLREATHAENMADSKARDRNAYGERHGMVKLTEPEVRTIRARYAAGETIAQLTRAYGRSRGCIQAVVERHSWRYVA